MDVIQISDHLEGKAKGRGRLLINGWAVDF